MSSPRTAGQTARARTDAPIPTQRDRGDDTYAQQLVVRKAYAKERLRNEQPDLRELALAVVADPPHVADAPPVLGWLSRLSAEGYVILERRHCEAGVIDYLAIVPSGVHVICARSFRNGHVEVRRNGGFLVPRAERLFIGGVDRTYLIADLWAQLEEVYLALADTPEVRVRPVLALADTALPLFSVLETGGVPIVGGRRLGQMLRKPGPLSEFECARLLRQLAAAFRPLEGLELGQDPLHPPAAG